MDSSTAHAQNDPVPIDIIQKFSIYIHVMMQVHVTTEYKHAKQQKRVVAYKKMVKYENTLKTI